MKQQRKLMLLLAALLFGATASLPAQEKHSNDNTTVKTLTINIQKALEYQFEGSALLSVKTDENGKATECDYLGSTILDMPYKKPSRIENLNVEVSNTHTSTYSIRTRQNDNNEYEQKARAVHKAIRKSAKPVIEAIEDGCYPLPANEQLYITINISSRNAEPYFPGGSSALREYVENSIKENEQIKKYGITGYLAIEFFIGTDGHPTNAGIKNSDFSRLISTAPLSRKKIKRITTKALAETFSNMPQWQPERADCRIANTLCTMQIEIR